MSRLFETRRHQRARIAASLDKREGWTSPKWTVFAASIVGFVIIANFSTIFGIVTGSAICGVVVIALAVRLWLDSERGLPSAERTAMIDRFERTAHARRTAKEREEVSGR
ncbi:MAG: hypothetical protein WA918_09570 [Erythrobacter sp.]